MRIALLVFAAAAAPRITLAAGPLEASDPRLQVVGITAPSRTATLASVRPARIAVLSAEEGAAVRAGEVVVSLDDTVQAARTDIARVKAESTHRIDLARARWKTAQREADRLVALRGGASAPAREVDDAVAVAEIARLNYELEVVEQAQARLAYEYEGRLLDEFHLHAPFDGYIIERRKQPGETVDQLEDIVTLVQLDPLDVLVNCPIDLAPLIMEGDAYPVTPLAERWPPQEGTVTFVSPVIDGASQTFRVRLSVENPDEVWAPGLQVIVDFKAPLPVNMDRHTAAPQPPETFKEGRCQAANTRTKREGNRAFVVSGLVNVEHKKDEARP